MTLDEEQNNINFFKGQAIQSVLERFEFSKEEIKLINDAIRTSKMKTPRISLINKTNEMLKEIVKTRKSIKKEKPMDEKSLERLKNATFKLKQRENGIDFTLVFLGVMALLAISVKLFLLPDTSTYTYEEALEYCQEKNQVLTNGHHEIGLPTPYNNKSFEGGIWVQDKYIYYDYFSDLKKDDGKKHKVICIDK